MGICMGAFAKRPYKHNSKKVIDYQFYRLCQSFGTLTKFMMHGDLCGGVCKTPLHNIIEIIEIIQIIQEYKIIKVLF